jgi:hypothetical protein
MSIGQSIRAKVRDEAFRARVRLSDEELETMRRRPGARFLVGVALIGFSFLFFAGGAAAASYAAVLTENAWWAVVGVPGAYWGSWGIFSLGMLLTGAESFAYVRLFQRWIVGRILGVRHGDAAGSGASINENRNV